MKQTFKKPSYYLLSQAMDGDEKAIEKILAFYDPYISKCCLRPLYDEYGKQLCLFHRCYSTAQPAGQMEPYLPRDSFQFQQDVSLKNHNES